MNYGLFRIFFLFINIQVAYKMHRHYMCVINYVKALTTIIDKIYLGSLDLRLQ